MRIMFVALPLIGHLFPMMPLAVHLARAGHEVRIATGGDAVITRDSGIEVHDIWAPPRSNFNRDAVGPLAFHPRIALRGARGLADAQAAGLVFAAVNRPMIDTLLTVTRSFAPDLVVHDPYAAAAAIAAARLGVASVLHNIALNDGTALLDQIMLRLGHTPQTPSAAVLSIAPPSLVSVPGCPMRLVPYTAGDGVAPRWLQATPQRPRILVTRSTVLGDGRNAMLSAMIRAAPHVDAEIVIVRPNNPILHATDLPDNVRTVGWIPLHSVLHTCTAMVNHGGAGSIYDALRAGIPQLATPAPGDRRWNASLLERRRIGLAVPAGKITVTHLKTLINDPDMRTAATRVADEMATMPTLDHIATKLAALTR